MVINNDLPIALQEAQNSRKEKAWGSPGQPSEPWQLPNYKEKPRSKSFKLGVSDFFQGKFRNHSRKAESCFPKA